ncbi:MAG TPA: class I SAM-dependent methyltransferase [Actinomycetota bacterium]|jgi:SAM-dependent methyltransferase|nr:class I SAM-dependent methyltransferase [Actinomycetota bacterium]
MADRDAYDAEYFTTLYGASPRQTWADRKRDARVVDLVRRHAPPRARGESLLDVGCGFGYLLRRFRGGFALFGIDLSAHAVREAGARLDGAVVAQANVEEGIPFRERFRVILAVNVIEHLGKPRAGVANIREALGPEGLCVVHLPTVNNLLNRAIYRFSYAKDPTHVFRPSGDEVVELFRSEGFSLLEQSYAPHVPRGLWNTVRVHPAYLAAFRKRGDGKNRNDD